MTIPSGSLNNYTNFYEHLNYYLMLTSDIFMILAPNIGYIAQVKKFKETKSSEGFSKFLSFILIIANILRIFFWVGKRFNTTLLIQSILSIIMQIYLLKECLKYSENNSANKKLEISKNKIKDINKYLQNPVKLTDINNFWNWPYLIDYIYFLCLFSIIIGFISHIIGYDNLIYIEILGTLSASVEAIIGIPQIIKNYKIKNTESLSSFLIYTWVMGDTFKTFYFLKTNAPLQLVCCGLFQLTTDFIILIQIFYYGNTNKNKLKDENISINLAEHKMNDYDLEGDNEKLIN